jgi:hypothetical protein
MRQVLPAGGELVAASAPAATPHHVRGPKRSRQAQFTCAAAYEGSSGCFAEVPCALSEIKCLRYGAASVRHTPVVAAAAAR